MDLVKIGRYVAEKRRGLGLTQRQLAEKLGMSDKSVSKWERGVCLPDVSVYMELCGILGISINEFLAGEDIPRENIAEKSEDNLIQVAAEGKRRQRRLKGIAAVFLALAILIAAGAGAVLFRRNTPENYIAAVDRDSPEMKTAQLLSGADGALLYKYAASGSFDRLTVYVSQYRSGELIHKDDMTVSHVDAGPTSEGIIAIVPDFERFTVRLILADGGTKFSTDIPILDSVADREYFGRSAMGLDAQTVIRYGEEQGLAVLIYGKDTLSAVGVGEYEAGNAPATNDYAYY
ncbi:MAG: helix-turn-helix transcriptional regulator, partial [Oscillospiraceae bacterium]|nr:helix-turn-helix transcriptional regulator [Oscillospiraceae bacterium]